MHPAIAAFPCQRFYGGRLLSSPELAGWHAPRGFRWPDPERPLAFLDCRGGREESTGESASWVNRAEAHLVVAVVKGLLSAGDLKGGAADVGVITPYSGQAKLLSDMLSEEVLPSCGESEGVSGEDSGGESEENSSGNESEKLEIKTVDGFQGREKEVRSCLTGFVQ